MKLGFKIFLELFILTLRRPFEAGQWIIAKRFSSELGWLSLLLVSIIGTVLVQLSFSMQPDEVRAAFAAALNSPLRMALVQGVFLVFSVFALHIFGHMAGGKGRFEDALALMVWFQVTLMVLQIGQVAISFIAPSIGALSSLLVFSVFFWVLTHFIMALHGFKSIWMVLSSLVLAMICLGFVSLIVLVGLILPIIGV